MKKIIFFILLSALSSPVEAKMCNSYFVRLGGKRTYINCLFDEITYSKPLLCIGKEKTFFNDKLYLSFDFVPMTASILSIIPILSSVRSITYSQASDFDPLKALESCVNILDMADEYALGVGYFDKNRRLCFYGEPIALLRDGSLGIGINAMYSENISFDFKGLASFSGFMKRFSVSVSYHF